MISALNLRLILMQENSLQPTLHYFRVLRIVNRNVLSSFITHDYGEIVYLDDR